MQTSRSRWLIAALGPLVLVAGACSTSPTAMVRIIDDGPSSTRFDPAVLEVDAGTEVRFRNSAAHPQATITLLGDDGLPVLPAGAQSWDSGLLQPGEAFAVQLDEPGVYAYTGASGDPGEIGVIEVVQP